MPSDSKGKRPPFTVWEQKILADNQYVYRITKKTITYTKEFKKLFWERINAGVNAVTIFTEAGINPDILGQARITSFTKQVRKQAELGREFCDGRNPSYPPEYVEKPKPKTENKEKLEIPKLPRLPKKKDTIRELYTDDDITNLIHNFQYMAQELSFIKKIISAETERKSK
jgi:hypothetical protein